MNNNRTRIVIGAMGLLLAAGLTLDTASARETDKKPVPVANANRPLDLTLRAERAGKKSEQEKRDQQAREQFDRQHEFDQKPLPRLDRVNLVGRDGVISESARFTVELRAENSRAVNFRVIW